MASTSSHLPGIELARGFYFDVVQKLIDAPHTAALLGEGSDVLGYDQPRSTDHTWGPRVQIFVQPAEVDRVAAAIDESLPAEYRGYPVQFYAWQTQSVKHHVEVTTLERWLEAHLRISGVDELTPAKWMALPQHHLLQFIAGAVFQDDTGELTDTKHQLSWYPTDVWLWTMASQWHLIGNTQHLIERTAEAMDFRGSTLIAVHLVRLIMELSFLQERRYWPYPKWFGTAFAELDIAPVLGPILDTALRSAYATQHAELNRALLLLGDRHNTLGLTEVVAPAVGDYEVGINNAVRPYQVMNAGKFANACKQAIQDESLRRLPCVGTIDQLTHADDLLINFTAWPQQLAQVYQHGLERRDT